MHSYHRPRRIRCTLGLCFVAFGGLVRAQGPSQNTPQCNFPFFAVGSVPDPCSMLGNVMSICAADNGASFMVPDINLGLYQGPTANTTVLEQCQCTEVGYNLYSACAACQLGDDNTHWLDRKGWFSGCTANFSLSQIPASSPRMQSQDFALWLTQKYIPTFSVAQAISVATGGPLPAVPATETDSAASVAATSTVKGSAASSNSNTPSSTTNTTPIIVGAVVGAFALFAIIALGIFLCIRRRQKQRTAPSAEFMKYSQVNATNAREPLRTHSRANTAEEEMQGHGYKRHSIIRLDSPGNGEDGGDIEMTEGGSDPPPFTPGLFKDPIFEKGVALNLAAASGGGSGMGGPYGGSPVMYSPATPSTQAHVATQYSERHGLIHGRQETL